MSYTLEDALKKCNFRFDLDYSGLKILNMEIKLHPDGRNVLESMGIEVQKDMRIGDVNDSLPKHAVHTTIMLAKYLKGAHIALYENSLPAFQEWLRDYNNHETYNIVGMSISHFNVTDYAQKMIGDKSYLTASVGNSSFGTGYPETDIRFDLVGACDILENMRDYSSWGLTNVDFTGIDGFEVMGEELFGTSFSRPFVTILAGCFTKLFYDNFNVFPTPLQLHHIMRRHSKKIDSYERSGYGLPIIPKNDNDIKWFEYEANNISDDIISAILPHKYGVNVYFDRLLNQDDNTLNKLAYLIRRHLHHYNLEQINYIGNGNYKKIDKLVKNSSVYIDGLESGKK